MSCPYLGEYRGNDYCEIAAKKLTPGKVSGTCESFGYTECSNYTTDGNDNDDDS